MTRPPLILTLMLGLWLFIPALAAATPAAAPPLEAYGRLPAFDLVRLSPSGERIAFVGVDGEKRRLFVRKVGGDALIGADIGTSKVRDVEWAGDDYVLVSVSVTDKYGSGRTDEWRYANRAEIWTMIVVDLKTGGARLMFKGASGILFNALDGFYGARRIGDRWYAMVHAEDLTLRGHIYQVDLQSGGFTNLTPIVGDDFGYFVDAAGGLGARTFYDHYTHAWSLFAGEAGRRVVTSRPSLLHTVEIAGPGRTPDTVIVTDVRDGVDTVEEYPLTPGATPTPLFSGVETDTLLHDRMTGVLIGATINNGQGAIFFDPKLQRRYDAARKAFGGYQVTLESYSETLAKMVIMTDGADDPGTFWIIDMTTGKAEELTTAYPGVPAAAVGPTRLFAYKAADGLDLEAVLTLPPGSDGKSLPLVVMPHGGPIGLRDRVGFDWWAQAFASRGYAVLQPNYRGSGGYGVAFREKGMGEWGRGMLTDISDGVDALAKAGVIDRARVCVVGASYGGYAALAGVTVQHGIYRCAVSVAGPSALGVMLANEGDSQYDAHGRDNLKLFGVRSSGDKALDLISPVRQAAKADAPILLIHGKNDTVVPYVHSEGMAFALTAAHKPVEFVTLDHEDHWLSLEASRVQTLKASVAFVEKHNPVSASTEAALARPPP